MNETQVLDQTTLIGSDDYYSTPSRPECDYVPASVEYIVNRVLDKKTVSGSDMASLRAIALHFLPGGSLNEFISLYLNETSNLVYLLEEAEMHIEYRHLEDAHQVLTDCMHLLHEWEFLRFEGPIRKLDDLLFLTGYEADKVAGWRKSMSYFDFTEVDKMRIQNMPKAKRSFALYKTTTTK